MVYGGGRFFVEFFCFHRNFRGFWQFFWALFIKPRMVKTKYNPFSEDFSQKIQKTFYGFSFTWSSIGISIQKMIQEIETTIPLGIKTCNETKQKFHKCVESLLES